MTTNIFEHVTGTARNTAIYSEAHVVRESTRFDVTYKDANADFRIEVNGALRTGGVDLVAGDTIRLYWRAPDVYMSAQCMNYSMYGEQHVWVAITEQSVAEREISQFRLRIIYDNLSDVNGVYVAPDNTQDKVTTYNPDGSVVATQKLYTVVEKPQGVKIPRHYKIVLNHFEKTISFINPDTGKLFHTIVFEYQPSGAAWVPINPSLPVEQRVYRLWVVSLNMSGIAHYSEEGQRLTQYANPGNYSGIAASPDGQRVYLTRRGYHTVHRFQYNGGWSENVFSTLSNPNDIACTNEGAYFSFLNSGALVRIPADSTQQQLQNVAYNIYFRGVSAVGNRLYATCQITDEVMVWENLALQHRVKLPSRTPYAIVATEDGAGCYVACHNPSVIYYVSFEGEVSRVAAAPRLVSQMFMGTNGRVMAASHYNNAPQSIVVDDREADPITLDSPIKLAYGEEYHASPITVTGINAETPVHLHAVPAAKAKLYINNIEQLNPTVAARSGAIVQVRVLKNTTTGILPPVVLTVGSQIAELRATYSAEDMRPWPFDLPTVHNAELSTEYFSERVTISGLGADTVVIARADVGTLLINGVATAERFGNVKNGDTLQLSEVSASDYTLPKFVRVTVGSFEEVWTVFTRHVEEEKYLHPTTDLNKALHDFLPFDGFSAQEHAKDAGRIKRLSKSSHATVEEFPFHGMGAGHTVLPTINDRPYLHAVVDPAARSVTALNMHDNADARIAHWEIARETFGMCSAPVSAATLRVPKVYYSSPQSSVLQSTDHTKAIALPGGTSPMGIACTDQNVLYVADGNSMVHTCRYNQQDDTFLFSGSVFIPSGGRLLDVFTLGTSAYVTDANTGSLHWIRNGEYYRTVTPGGRLPYASVLSGTVIYMAYFGDAKVAAIDCETMTLLRIVDLPTAASQPTAIAHDPVGNKLYVGCARSHSIFVLDGTTLQQTGVINDVGPVWGLDVDDTDIYALTQFADVLEIYGVGTYRVGPNSLTYAGHIDAAVNTNSTSAHNTVTDNIVTEERIWIEPFTGAYLSRNGTDVGQETTVRRGDRIALTVRSHEEHDTRRNIEVFGYNFSARYFVHTGIDRWPNELSFPLVSDLLPRMPVTSAERVISGLGQGVSIRIYPAYTAVGAEETGLSVIVDDVLIDRSETRGALVTNGSRIRLTLNTQGMVYGGISEYVHLFTEDNFRIASWRLVSAYTQGAIRFDEKSDSMDHAPDVIEWQPNSERISDIALTASTRGYSGNELSVPQRENSVLHVASVIPDGEQPTVVVRQRNEVSPEGERASAQWNEKTIVIPNIESAAAKWNSLNAIVPNIESATAKWNTFNSVVPNIESATAKWNTFNSVVPNIESAAAEPHMRTLLHIPGVSQSEDRRADTVKLGTNNGPIVHERSTPHGRELMTWLRKQYSTLTAYLATYAEPAKNVSKVKSAEYLWNLPTLIFYSPEYARNVVKPLQLYAPDYRHFVVDRPNLYAVEYQYEQHHTRYTFAAHASYEQINTSNKYAEPSEYVHAEGKTWDDAPVAEYVLGETKIPTAYEFSANRFNSGVVGSYAVSTVDRVAAYRAQMDADFTRNAKGNAPVSTTAEYVAAAPKIVFDSFEYTAPNIRAFISEDAAISSVPTSVAEIVFAKKLYDGLYMWHTPPEIERVVCETDSFTTVVRGYVQGG